MNEYKVIKKDNKFLIRNDFWGDMMVYGAKSNKPYVKRMGSKFYLTGDVAVMIREGKEGTFEM